MDQARTLEIMDMLRQFNENLEKATSSSKDPQLTSTLSVLGSAFKLFQSLVMDEISKIKESVAKIEELETKNEDLEERLENMEQYSRRNCLLLRGIPENSRNGDTEQDCLQHVMSVIKDRLKVDINEDAISRCHRLGGSNRRDSSGYARPIIIKFVSYKQRRLMFSAKKLLKSSPYSISEFLTQHRLKIYREARAKHGPQNCWTSDGKILVNVRNSDGSFRRVVVRKSSQIPPVSVVQQIPPPTGGSSAANTLSQPDLRNVNMNRGSGTQEIVHT